MTLKGLCVFQPIKMTAKRKNKIIDYGLFKLHGLIFCIFKEKIEGQGNWSVEIM